MSWFIIPRIENILEQRRHKIDGYIQKAEKTNKKALSSLEKYETALKKANTEAQVAICENNAALVKDLADQRQHNQQVLAEKIADNAELLQQQRQQAMASIEETSLDLAVDVLRKIGFKDVEREKLKPYLDGE